MRLGDEVTLHTQERIVKGTVDRVEFNYPRGYPDGYYLITIKVKEVNIR